MKNEYKRIKTYSRLLATQDPYLDLGNCCLTDAHVAEGTEFDKLLHLQTLVLSNGWYE